MSEHQILDLIFQSFSSFQTVWGIFTTVTIGLLAAIFTFPKHLNSILARLILIIGFLLFAYVNRMALSKLLHERCELRVKAFDILKIDFELQIYDCGYGIYNNGIKHTRIDMDRWKNLDPLQRMVIVMDPSSYTDLKLFHWIQTGLMGLLIWLLPRQLVRLKPDKKVMDKIIRIKNSSLPNPMISFNIKENMWELKQDIVVKRMYLNDDLELRIEKGFMFDLASIPRFLWSIIAPFELSIIAPLVHDYLYVNKGKLIREKDAISATFKSDIKYDITRHKTDSIFFAHMRDENVGKVKSYLAYQAVSLFGWIYWKEMETQYNKPDH